MFIQLYTTLYNLTRHLRFFITLYISICAHIYKYSQINNYSFISKLSLIKKCYIKYDAIIFSGYNSFLFLMLWFVHIFAKIKKPISIISDTPLNIPSNFFKRFIKFILCKRKGCQSYQVTVTSPELI